MSKEPEMYVNKAINTGRRVQASIPRIMLKLVLGSICLCGVPTVSSLADDRPCCEQLIDKINRFQKVHHSLAATESQYFASLGKILGKLQDVDQRLAETANNAKKKWQFDGAKAVADGIAGLSLSVVVSGIDEISKTPVTSIVGATEKKAFLSVGKEEAIETGAATLRSANENVVEQFVYAQQSGKDMASGLPDDSDLRRLRYEANSIRDKFNELEGIVDEIAACHHCKLTYPRRVNSTNDIDPASRPNAPIRKLQQSAINELRGGKIACNICAILQQLRNAIEAERYIVMQKAILYKQSIQLQKSQNALGGDIIQFLSRNKWDEGWLGKSASVIRGAIASAGGPIGFIANYGISKFVDYKQGNIMAGAMKNYQDSYLSIKKSRENDERWAEAWKEVDTPIRNAVSDMFGLTAYKYGKCNNECGDKTIASNPPHKVPSIQKDMAGKNGGTLIGSPNLSGAETQSTKGATLIPGNTGHGAVMVGQKPQNMATGKVVDIPGAADITKPIIRDMPKNESTASKATSAIGGMLGGMAGMGGGNPFGGGGGKGASLVRRPKGPWDDVSNGKTALQLGGWMYMPKSNSAQPQIRIAQKIADSPDNGAPDSMWLQDGNGNILQPVGFMVFEVWRHWRLTITITRETYVNGVLVDRKVTRESTQWKELVARYKTLLTAPSIWERLGGHAFDKLRGVIVEFPLPAHFDPLKWSLISHITSKATVNGKEVIKTVPFVLDIVPGEHNRLRFKPAPDGLTNYQRSHAASDYRVMMAP